MSASPAKIGPVLAACIVAGNMIGSGIFLLPAVLASVGSGSIIGWLLGALCASLLAGVYGILATHRPPSEGLLDYPIQALHPVAGFINWLAYWLGCWVGTIGILLAAVGYGLAIFSLEFGRVTETGILIAAIWVVAIINLIGPKFMARFSAATLVIGLLPIAAAILIGFFKFDVAMFQSAWNVSGKPIIEATSPIVLTIFWAFLGMESANAVSRIVKNPQTNVPLAAIAGTVSVAVIYALATTALFGLIPVETLGQSSAPFADAISIAVGPIAGLVVAAAAFARTFGCAGSWFLVSAEANRVAIDHGYLPGFLSRALSAESKTRDTIIIAALMTIVSAATISPTLNQQFILIVDITVLIFLLVYALSSLSLIKFAQDFDDRKQKNRAMIFGWLGLISSLAITFGYFAF